ncbi:MAG: alpha/beta hydrolase [Azospirillaceae bacterium]
MTAAQDPPQARQGPRPLAFHLAAAQTAWMTSLGVLPISRLASLASNPPWPTPPTEAETAQVAAAEAQAAEAAAAGADPGRADRVAELAALARALGAADPAAAHAALAGEIARRFDAFLTGLERYRHHPYRRALPDPPVLWREGGTRLLDFGGLPGAAADGQPVLVVPSLVNRGYVLDLTEATSLMRWLAAGPAPGGRFRPLLVDWGWPDEAARHFTLTDYVAGRLERAFEAALTTTGGPMPVLGYCMGGLLAVALAARRRDVSALALLATPWDFHAEDPGRATRLAAAMEPFRPAIATWGALPVDGVQMLFAMLDPLLALDKFARFARMPEDSPRVEPFVALEDWLNDGVPLAGPVAMECLDGWYGRNTPAAGAWAVAGAPVVPETLSLPSLHVVPDRDRIVPPASARGLAGRIPGSETLSPALGHIGMIVGGRGRAQVWEPLASWLATHG